MRRRETPPHVRGEEKLGARTPRKLHLGIRRRSYYPFSIGTSTKLPHSVHDPS
jgi:hypothetical protein